MNRPNPQPELMLVIDQGGHATRAFVFDPAGAVQAQAQAAVSVRRLDAQRVEQDPEEIVASARAAIAAVQAQLGTGFARIARAGLATQRSSIVCWDRLSGSALSPVLSWQDRRAHAWLAQFAPHAARVHGKTGLVLSPHYGVSKLRWCLDQLPAVARAAHEHRLCFGPLASFMVSRLATDRPCLVDVANAARTLLLDLDRRDWDPELLALFGIPRESLPACVSTRHDFGRLAPTGIPLRVVTGDQSAALFAHGEPRVDTAYVNVGTGAFIQRPTGRHPVFHSPLLTGIVSDEPGCSRYVLEGTVNGAGSALAWLASEQGASGLEARLPAWLEDPAEPPLFINGVSGLGSPYWVPDVTPRFAGTGGLPGKAVAVVESIVFLLRDNLAEMIRAGGGLRAVMVGGGLSQLDGLCQRLADLSGVPVSRADMPEMTARGVAWLLAGNASWRPPAVRDFTARANPPLQDRYRRWRQALARALAQRPT